MIMSENKRKIPRFRTDPIYAKIACGMVLYPAYITSISEEGLKIHVEEDLPETDFSVIVPLSEETDDSFLVLKAKKRWIQKDEQHGLFLIGCEFADISINKRTKILQLIELVKKN